MEVSVAVDWTTRITLNYIFGKNTNQFPKSCGFYLAGVFAAGSEISKTHHAVINVSTVSNIAVFIANDRNSYAIRSVRIVGCTTISIFISGNESYRRIVTYIRQWRCFPIRRRCSLFRRLDRRLKLAKKRTARWRLC